MSNIPRLTTAAAVLTLAAASLIAAPAASAHHPGSHHGHHSTHGQGWTAPSEHVLASGLLSPLRAAVSDNGTAYVSENFAGKIDRIGRNGTKTTVYTDPNGYEVGGLSTLGRYVAFTVTQSVGEGENLDSWLKVLTPSGNVRTIADIHAYEAANNPDQGTTYGFRDADTSDPATAACLAKWNTAENGPATYTGQVDSHPYATYVLNNGWTYVADAGANAIFLVSPWGQIRTVATLPAIPQTIDATTATGLGLDPCFVGLTYYFEPVPTDVEVGSNGTVYVTSLPGGPEGPQSGARGSVFAISAHAAYHGNFRLHPGHHHGNGYYGHQARQVVTGLMSPTGLAVAPHGTLYVAQLFGDSIAKVSMGRWGGQITGTIATPSPGEVEWTPRGLYFTNNVLSGTPDDPHGNTTTPMGQLIRYGR
ncbi:ScyD/ScyE family protein [Nocardioides sp. BP30]|uniref:ScyD/ScyE family protein n=1 Tax=Nocardioides sp. BP30 TaxID=3036374 RepID=UPI0024685EF4|nr:ScyD/ScyE family protein [Nocardioides sp. BP30]WGL51569.1 ScyD/ScyE family protein [Nocardioides sp. BP30]